MRSLFLLMSRQLYAELHRGARTYLLCRYYGYRSPSLPARRRRILSPRCRSGTPHSTTSAKEQGLSEAVMLQRRDTIAKPTCISYRRSSSGCEAERRPRVCNRVPLLRCPTANATRRVDTRVVVAMKLCRGGHSSSWQSAWEA